VAVRHSEGRVAFSQVMELEAMCRSLETAVALISLGERTVLGKRGMVDDATRPARRTILMKMVEIMTSALLKVFDM